MEALEPTHHHLLSFKIEGGKLSPEEVSREMQSFYPGGQVLFSTEGNKVLVHILPKVSTQERVALGDGICGHIRRLVYA